MIRLIASYISYIYKGICQQNICITLFEAYALIMLILFYEEAKISTALLFKIIKLLAFKINIIYGPCAISKGGKMEQCSPTLGF